MRYLPGSGTGWPWYINTGVAALCKALLRARINVHDERTLGLLSCLQNEQRRTALLPTGGAAYRGACGGCPIGSFIRPADLCAKRLCSRAGYTNI